MSNWRPLLRKWSARGHWWLGLGSGVLFTMLGLSGSIITFRPQIEVASTPLSIHACSFPEGPNEAIETANPSLHGRAIDRIYYLEESNSLTYVLQAAAAGSQRTLRLSVDPCEKKVLGQVPTAWLDWLVDFHHNFLTGKKGRVLVGLSGVGLLLAAFSGLLLWMQAGARWKLVFRIERNASIRRFAIDLHRCTGIIVIPLLLIQALTGVSLAFPDAIRTVASTSTRPSPHRADSKSHRKEKTHGGFIDLDRAVTLSSTVVPAGVVREIRLPSNKNNHILIRLWTPGDLRMSGDNAVITDALGTKVLSLQTWANTSGWAKVSQVITFLHYGEWAGLLGRCLLAVLGLTPLVLFITGLVFKWGPRRKRIAAVAERKHMLDSVA